MKKILFMAAAAAMIFASCAKTENQGPKGNDGLNRVTVRISGVKAAQGTRAVGAVGAQGNLKMNTGTIFVIDALNNVNQSVTINTLPLAAGATAIEQVIEGVASDSRIYILGNIPSDITVSSLTTLDAIEAAASTISTTVNNDYAAAALANNDGTPKALTIEGEGEASVAISLSPLYSRMELHKLTGGEHITSFTVAGVYVDDYFAAYTMTGASSGNKHEQLQNEVFTGVMGDNAGWESDALTPAVAVAGTDKVWNYHVASAGLPRFIIHLSEVNYMTSDDGGSTYDVPATIDEDRYITVSGYTEALANGFERGKIYRIGAGNGITFELDDLGTTPNPEDVDLTVEVDVIDWVITDLTPSI